MAEHLRVLMMRGCWGGEMPGADHLAREFGVGSKTVDAALHELEQQGWLVSQGVGRRRRIQLPKAMRGRGLRIHILPYHEAERGAPHIMELFTQLNLAGFDVEFAKRGSVQLGMDVGRIAKLVESSPADVWIVVAGSRPVLEWFAGQPFPVFALFGDMRQLPLAGTGPAKAQALRQMVRRFIEHGHRRIVMLKIRKSEQVRPGHIEQLFIEELQAAGIRTGEYNVATIGRNAAELRRTLEGLFGLTPPTAILVDGYLQYLPVVNYLASTGRQVPGDVSLACLDPHLSFDWCVPQVAHIDYDPSQWAVAALKWAREVARGRHPTRQLFTEATFIEGGAIAACRDEARPR